MKHRQLLQTISKKRNITFYEMYVKRFFDIICSLIAIIILFPLYLLIAILVMVKLGTPVIFTQLRPGIIDEDGNETIFKMYKFRSMSNSRNKKGELLPDEMRLTKFGKWLRSTSLDELPELFNILNGSMSIVGPRPQLVKDMVFMTADQRARHTAKPGLTGLAQVNGRNAISWDNKLEWDLEYIKDISMLNDLAIMFKTIKKAFIREGISQEGMATSEDLGDYLLRINRITKEEYDSRISEYEQMMGIKSPKNKSNIKRAFSVAISVYKNDNPIYFEKALESITDNQTVKPNEIVLVVDGQVPSEINAIIDKYSKKYSFFKIIRLETNSGLGNALRVAVQNSTCDLIARMDSDDISLPDRFEKQLDVFENTPNVDIVGGDITEFIGDEKNVVGRRSVPKNHEDIVKYMKKRCAMNHVSVMYKKDAVLSAGGYLDWFWNEDYYLWIRMMLNNSTFSNTGDVLVNVRVGDEMYQRRGGKRYYESEKQLQKYMLANGIINYPIYCVNVLKRFIVQILLPNRIRGFVFRTFARDKR